MHGLSNVAGGGMGRLQNSLRSPVQKPPSFTFFCRLMGGKLFAGLPEKGLKEHLFPGYGISAVVSHTKSREFPVGV